MKKSYIKPYQMVCELQSTDVLMLSTMGDQEADPNTECLTKESNTNLGKGAGWNWDEGW